jgi:hypothetical protein
MVFVDLIPGVAPKTRQNGFGGSRYQYGAIPSASRATLLFQSQLGRLSRGVEHGDQVAIWYSDSDDACSRFVPYP